MKTKTAQLVQIYSLHPLTEAWEMWILDSPGFKDLHACLQTISSRKTADQFSVPFVFVYQNPHPKMIPNNDNSAEVFWILFLILIWLKLYCWGPISTLRNDCSLNPVNCDTDQSIYGTQASHHCTGSTFEICHLTFNMNVLSSVLSVPVRWDESTINLLRRAKASMKSKRKVERKAGEEREKWL